MDKVHKIFKKCAQNDISIVVRDRPFERTVTMHKDAAGRIGFQFNNGKIVSIVKDSSAARNGLLIEHQLLEVIKRIQSIYSLLLKCISVHENLFEFPWDFLQVNGQNIIGMKDKDITDIILNGNEPVITVTIIPSFIYDHMMKK